MKLINKVINRSRYDDIKIALLEMVKELDLDYYKSTCGVINNFVCDTIDEVQKILSEIIGNKKIVIA